MKPVKPKKCRACKDTFQPRNSLQVVCSPLCAIEYDREKKAKKEKRQLADDRKVFKLSDKKVQRNLAQKAFNRFIRLRDKDLPCISCGTTNDVVYCAGHYRTRGAMSALSFDESNVHKQCNKRCNLELSGNIREYRPNLIAKIGQKKVDWLDGPHEAKNFTAEDYVAIKKKYLAMGNELESKLVT